MDTEDEKKNDTLERMATKGLLDDAEVLFNRAARGEDVEREVYYWKRRVDKTVGPLERVLGNIYLAYIRTRVRMRMVRKKVPLGLDRFLKLN